MEVIDKIVGWAVAMSPLVGGVWMYFASRNKRKGQLPEQDGSDSPVIQGQPVNIDHTSDFIDFLKADHAELTAELAHVKRKLDAAHSLLNQNNIRIPPTP